jgi:hypothetical protein
MTEEGKSHLAHSKLTEAIQCFEKAVQSGVEAFGELDERVAPLYLQYGNALFLYAKENCDMFGSAVEQAQADAALREDEYDEEEYDEEEEGLEDEHDEVEEEDEEEDAEEEDDEEVDGDEQIVDEEANEEEEGTQEAENPSGSDSNDFQVAFENLDAARVIYSKSPEKYQDKLVEVHSILGELNLELNNFEEAEKELNSALEIVKKSADPSPREVAFLLYLIGISYSGNDNFSVAFKYFTEAFTTLASAAEKLMGTELDKSNSEIVLKTIAGHVENVKEVPKELVDLYETLQELYQKLEEHKFSTDSSNPDSNLDIKSMIVETFKELRESTGFVEREEGVDEHNDGQAGKAEVTDLGVISSKRKSESSTSSSDNAKKSRVEV